MQFIRMTVALACAVPCMLMFPGVARGDTIVQMGFLSGTGEPQTQSVFLNQFDTLGGTRQLNFVQLHFLTSVIGGFETNGSGVPVHIFAQLDANWSLAGQPLVNTQALIDTTILNTNVGSASVFNSDPHTLVLDQQPQLQPWIGSGQIELQAFTQFVVFDEPAGVIDFSAGGTVRYTVTYDYAAVPGPGGLAMLMSSAGWMALGRRTRLRG
jgi:hypothetical protein